MAPDSREGEQCSNRSKSTRGPENWQAEDRSYWRRYVVDWITQDTSISPPSTLNMTRWSRSQYLYRASADAVQAAAEMRIPGVKGNGRGLPKSIAPSARNGDSDGVV